MLTTGGNCIRDAFEKGFKDGQADSQPITIRRAETENPLMSSAEIDAYMNGHDDGMKNDRWRLNYS